MLTTSSVSSLDIARRARSPGVEDREALGDVANKIEALLDQQDGALLLRENALESCPGSPRRRRAARPSVGSSKSKQFRLLHQGAGDGELLLLPPGKDAALAVVSVSEGGK